MSVASLQYYLLCSIFLRLVLTHLLLIYCVNGDRMWNMLCSLYMYTETVDGSLVTGTVPAHDGFFWTTFSAVARKQVSHIVNTVAGGVTTVDKVMMSLSLAIQVLLRPNDVSRSDFIFYL